MSSGGTAARLVKYCKRMIKNEVNIQDAIDPSNEKTFYCISIKTTLIRHTMLCEV